jgi:glucose-1-phosphatase
MISHAVDWLVVDLGGVAAQYRPERRLEALEQETGIPREIINQRLFTSGLDHDAELGRHTIESITSTILDRLEHRLSIPSLIDAWALAFEPNLELLDAITPLRPSRALLTNNGPMLDLCLSGPLAQLASKFEASICSWHLTATKPNPEAFTRAASRLLATPPQLLLIDNSETNINAARTAGWHAIPHTSNASTLPQLETELPTAPAAP